MHSNKPSTSGVLSADVKAALAAAVERMGSQTKVAADLGVSSPVISTLLKDKYTGNVAAMETRIRGQYMAETVDCPVMGALSSRDCLDYQSRPPAFTNPVRAALSRSCKSCPHRRASS